MRNSGDAFQTRRPDGTFFHGLSYGTADPGCLGIMPALNGGPDGLHINTSGTNTTYQFINNTNDDFRSAANYTSAVAGGTQSAGLPNSCNNAQWIGSLRRPPESVFETPIGGCNTNLSGPPETICIGEQIMLELPNTNNCQSDSYSWSYTGSGNLTIISGGTTSMVTVEGTQAGSGVLTVTATLDNMGLYNQGGCSGPPFPQSLDYDIPITIIDGPSANDASLNACDQGGGTGLFDLTSIENIVNGGSGNPVLWYQDIGTMIPILNPAAYSSGNGFVFAVVSDGGPCPSAVATITLNVATQPAAFPASLSACNEGGGIATFNLTDATNTVNGGTGLSVDYWFDIATTIPINPATNYLSPTSTVYATVDNNGCISAPVAIDLIVLPNGFPILGVASLCESDPPLNLNTLIDPNYPNGTWSGPGVSGILFNPLGQNGGVTITYTPTGCGIPATTTITVNPAVSPNLGIATLCQTDLPFDLVALQDSNFPGGAWSGPGVSGSTFDPAGQSGNITLTFTPTAACSMASTTTIEVEAPATPSLGSWTLCDDDFPFDLSFLEDPNYMGGTWSGPGVSGNQFDPAGQDGPVTLTYTPASGSCATSSTTDITVVESQTPNLGSALLCDNDIPFELTNIQDANFPNGTWSGTGVTGTLFDPAGQSGTITITFTSSEFCVNPATTEIEVVTTTVPMLGTVSVCDSDGLLDLTSLEDPNFPGGTWSGPGVSGTEFDPSGQNGPVVLDYVPNSSCALATTTTIEVGISGTPVLGAASVCDTDGLVDLTQLQDPNYPNGSWSGTGVSGTEFDPTGQNGAVTITFTSSDNCVLPANTDIEVTITQTPVLDSITVCETEGIIDLNGLADPNFPNGTWSGPGVSGTTFDPAGLLGTNTLTFTPDGLCALAATSLIVVTSSIEPVLQTAMLCEGDGLFDLSNLSDPNFPTGSWTGTGVVGNEFDPTGLNGPVTLTFTPSDDCGVMVTTEIEVNTAPGFSGLTTICNPTNTTYTVSFDITGGDPTSYTVDGMAVVGTTFTSGAIASGMGYQFEIDDANGCGPILVSGSFDCLCGTFSGTLQIPPDPLVLCAGEDFSVTNLFNNDQTLDPDDVLGFILHDSPGPGLGTIYATSTDANFSFPVGLDISQTYYISAIAGNNDGSGNVDVNDPCLSVSPGVEVQFYELAFISDVLQTAVCEDDCIEWALEFDGIAEYFFEYEITTPGGTSTEVFSTFESLDTLTICPADLGVTDGVIELIPVSLEDATCQISLDALPSFSITVISNSTTTINPTLCPGEIVTVNGTIYDQNNPTGTEMIPGSPAQGCDSTFIIDLSFYPEATGLLEETFCSSEQILINGTIYDENNPSGTEIIQNGSINGCDSTLTINLTFIDEVTFNLEATLCSDETVVINGVTYDINNPIGTEVFSGGSSQGCDSIVEVQLDFFPPAMGDFNTILCEGEFLIIGGMVFDEGNPSGQVLFENGSINGCDSTLNVAITFLPASFTDIEDTLQPGESILVNGVTYDASNSSGVEVIIGGAANGCDSTITVNLTFAEWSIEYTVQDVGCFGFNDGQILIDTIIGGKPDYSTSLDGNFFVQHDSFPIILSGLVSGVYILSIQDADNQIYTEQIVILSPPENIVDLGPDTTLSLGQSLEIQPSFNFNAQQINWTPASFLDCDTCFTVLVEQPTTDIQYMATLLDENGCPATDLITISMVKPRRLFLPNVFSPNGDGSNDEFTVFAGPEVAQIQSMQIFNRWGDLVFSRQNFQPNDPAQGWDGRFRGSLLNTNVFVFYVEAAFIDGTVEVFKGDVLLMK
jgi:gliding motility-associated-like protein